MEQLEEIVEEVRRQFDGRDPVHDALERLDRMSTTEMKALVFISANKLGTALKGGGYDDTLDSLLHICGALEIIFDAYDNAELTFAANTLETGCA